MSTSGMDRREELCEKIQNYFLYFRRSMLSNLDPIVLFDEGVDSCQFDLVEETMPGSRFFRPMSQERLDTLVKRPAIYELSFWKDDGYPCIEDADMVQDLINDQLRFSRDEDLWSAYECTLWEPVGTCCDFEDRLFECDSGVYPQTNDPTRQAMWYLRDMFATKDGLPHRSCIACAEVFDVAGPTRHEMMILTGLMIVRMRQKDYLKHEIFPVLMLSLYGSKGRIVQAHMCPEQQRLKVRYSELFDFRSLAQEWLDIFVRWFLNDPLTELSPSLDLNPSE